MTQLRMNRETYYDLLDSQRADGSFDWPVKFLQRLGHQSQEPASWPQVVGGQRPLSKSGDG